MVITITVVMIKMITIDNSKLATFPPALAFLGKLVILKKHILHCMQYQFETIPSIFTQYSKSSEALKRLATFISVLAIHKVL